MLLSIPLLFGCGAVQRIDVDTTPPGAQVTLTRYGVTEIRGGFAGANVEGLEGSFEEEPITLGTSPLEYEFDLEEDERRISVAGASVEVVRRYTEGFIRAERDGQVAERRVRFTGDPIALELLLTTR